jgi:hypothetical protein
MRSIWIVATFLLAIMACRISESKITGKYLDKVRDDTLRITANHTYEFEERLKGGEHGWNSGKWHIENNRVYFTDTKPLPVVGYRIGMNKTASSADALQLYFTIDKFKNNVLLSSVTVWQKGKQLDTSFVNLVSNRVVVKTANFDSLAVKLDYFPVIGLSKHKFDDKGVYNVIIYPSERLYELDKLSYQYKKRSLINRSHQVRYQKVESKY